MTKNEMLMDILGCQGWDARNLGIVTEFGGDKPKVWTPDMVKINMLKELIDSGEVEIVTVIDKEESEYSRFHVTTKGCATVAADICNDWGYMASPKP